MAHVNGIAAAGHVDATRVAQTLVHRAAEAGTMVVVGERIDRARAEKIPEATAATRLDRRPRRERDPRDRRREGDGPRDDQDSEPGALVDLQA